MTLALLFLVTLLLAYANGANDNFKPVATLYGSGTVSFKLALVIATTAQIAGSLCAIFLAQELISNFSGKGLVPEGITRDVVFVASVGLGAALTVILATVLGFPISTTHSLVGGLVGAGVTAMGLEVNFARLGNVFMIPLLLSPFIALLVAAGIYRLLRVTRQRFGLSKESCVCIGNSRQYIPLSRLTPEFVQREISLNEKEIAVLVANQQECVERYTGQFLGVAVQKLLDIAHIISAASVSFARGLNDTPKIAGLLVIVSGFNIQWGILSIAIAMALGGILSSYRVAETMSHKITRIDHGQGFSANITTALMVIVASKLGMPVSTTHVSVGSIFGITLGNRSSNWSVIRNIILSWLVTLPLAAGLSAVTYLILGEMIGQ